MSTHTLEENRSCREALAFTLFIFFFPHFLFPCDTHTHTHKNLNQFSHSHPHTCTHVRTHTHTPPLMNNDGSQARRGYSFTKHFPCFHLSVGASLSGWMNPKRERKVEMENLIYLIYCMLLMSQHTLSVSTGPYLKCSDSCQWFLHNFLQSYTRVTYIFVVVSCCILLAWNDWITEFTKIWMKKWKP